jgi:hypothetical protein
VIVPACQNGGLKISTDSLKKNLLRFCDPKRAAVQFVKLRLILAMAYKSTTITSAALVLAVAESVFAGFCVQDATLALGI